MSNILSFEVAAAASVAAVLRLESLIFGIALSLSGLCGEDEVSCGVTGDGVRERSELATDDDEQQSGPVDIGSGEDGDEDADCSVGGGCEVVEHLEVEDDEEGFGGDFDDAALG